MSIKFYRKNVYGQTRLYLADDFYNGYVGILTGKETVNEDDLHALSKISGQQVEEVLDPNRPAIIDSPKRQRPSYSI